MKIEVNLKKKYFISIVVLLIVVAGIFFVYAFGGNSPSTLGHSAGEMEVIIGANTYSLQQAINVGLLGNSSGVVSGQLDCNTVSSGFKLKFASASCALGYNLTGGACDIIPPVGGALISLDGVPLGNTYNCDLEGQNSNVSAYAFCCRVVSGAPGASTPISTFNATGRTSYNYALPSGNVGWYACGSGYVVSAVHQNHNGVSYFTDYVTCSPVPYIA